MEGVIGGRLDDASEHDEEIPSNSAVIRLTFILMKMIKTAPTMQPTLEILAIRVIIFEFLGYCTAIPMQS